jgi:hypothetical protein
MQEILCTAENFTNCVRKSAMHAQKNVKNMLPTMLAARNVLKLVENVLKYVESLPLDKSVSIYP